MLIPHDKLKYGIVIEIKQIALANNENEQSFRNLIDKKINEAIAQIDNNQHYKELVANMISNMIKLPIVFAGKVPYIILY